MKGIVGQIFDLNMPKAWQQMHIYYCWECRR